MGPGASVCSITPAVTREEVAGPPVPPPAALSRPTGPPLPRAASPASTGTRAMS